MKDYDTKAESSYLISSYHHVIKSVWTVSRKLPVDSFEWRKDGFRFDEDFINSYDDENSQTW